MDISKQSYNIGAPFFEEAGVAHKIDFREGPALGIIQALVAEVCEAILLIKMKEQECRLPVESHHCKRKCRHEDSHDYRGKN